jgi:hypothetical protein
MKASDFDPKMLILISVLGGGGIGTVGQYLGITAPLKETKSEIAMAAELMRGELRWCMGELKEHYEGEEAWLMETEELPARLESVPYETP